MHDSTLNDELPPLPASSSDVPALGLLWRIDRRYVAGCVAGLILGGALGVPVAYALLRAEREASARSAAQRANENDLAQLVSRGMAALEQRDYGAALEIFRQAERTNAPNAKLSNNICVALNDLGRYQEAMAACEQALQLDPSFTLARNNYAWAMSQLAKPRTTPARP